MTTGRFDSGCFSIKASCLYFSKISMKNITAKTPEFHIHLSLKACRGILRRLLLLLDIFIKRGENPVTQVILDS
jgi:hypothetical protein